jgi:ubiquinone/menaquinone biosynthesis C-methylase UbiE
VNDHHDHDHDAHDHDAHDHDAHGHGGRDDGHGHGHAHDQGWRGMARYLRMTRRMWSSPVSDAVVDLVAPVPGELVVDLGAGMGPATVRAARAGAQVLAIDPTPGMRRVLGLRRRIDRSRAHISVHAGAAESMPVATGSVDALWCVNAMHHWTDQAAALVEIARVVRPGGGRIVLVDEDFADPTHPSHEAHQARGARHQHHFDHVDPVQVGARLADIGFTVVEAGTRELAGRPVRIVRARRA